MGYTTKIGYLDKGGKWRKKDWYIQKDGLSKKGQIDREEEMRKVQLEDERRMKIALGIIKPNEPFNNLTHDEINELNIRIKQSNPDA